MAYVSLQQQQQQFLGKPGQNNQTGGMKLQAYTPLSQQQESYLKTDTGKTYKPIASSTTKQQPQQSAYQKAGPVRQAISNAAGAYMNVIKNLPEAHFADKLNFFTPLGFVANLAQGLINTPAEALKGAQSLGQHAKAGTSTPQQVVGDVAAAVQLPLLLLTGGTSSVAKEGIVQTVKNTAAQGIKGAVKAVAKEGIIGGGYGLLSGFQSGKNITSVSDYVKNLLQNVGIGAVAGSGVGAITHAALPLAKGLSHTAGAVFVKNIDKTPEVQQIHLDPKVAQSTVLSNNLEHSIVGKAILKESVAAQEAGQHVAIIPSKEGGYTLPNGGRVDVTTTPIYNPANAKTKETFSVKSDANLSPEGKITEAKFTDYVTHHTTEAIQKYNELPGSQEGKILNTDVARELSSAYAADRTKSAHVHEPASALIKEIYKRKLEQPAPEGKNIVLFTAGGTGAGKSTAIENIAGMKALTDHAGIIYDTNSAKTEGNIGRINQALKAGREVVVTYVHRDPVDALVHGALPRAMKMGRTVPIEEHFNTHFNGPEAFLKTAEHFKDNEKVQFRVIDNSKGKGNAEVVGFDKLRQLMYNKEELRANLHTALEKEYVKGNIDEKIYNGFKGEEKSHVSEASGGRNDKANDTQSQREPQKPEVKSSTTSQQPVGTGKPRESEAFSKFVDNLKDADPKRYEELKDGKITYNRLNLENDAKNAMKLVEKDPQQAYRIAKGIESAPAGQTETAISIALADRAGKEKDYKLQSELESSRSLRQTRRGQEIVSERGRFTDTSPYHYIQQLIDTRMKKVGGSLLSKIQEEIPGQKTSAKKAAVERVDREVVKVKLLLTKEQRKIKLAQNILDSLTCK